MNEPIVKTRNGAVRGSNVQGVAAFKGIPYAAPPVKAIRQGASATVDLLLGTNSQEMNLYYVPTGLLNLVDSDEKVCASIGNRHPQPESLVAAYRACRPDASSGELFHLGNP